MSDAGGPTVLSALKQAAQVFEPDRALAALLAPRDKQLPLMALAALGSELRRIPSQVREPIAGEVRLQWWRDALRSELSTGNPIAGVVRSAVGQSHVLRSGIDAVIDAHAETLYAGPPADYNALEHELIAKDGTLFAAAGEILGDARAVADGAIYKDAALAYGLARLFVELPRTRARGRMPLPGLAAGSVEGWDSARHAAETAARSALQRVKLCTRSATAAQKLALLPLVMAGPYLRTGKALGHNPVIGDDYISPLGRIWRIGLAHWTGRIA